MLVHEPNAFRARLPDDALDRIDELVPPGTYIGRLDVAYDPPAIQPAASRTHPVAERTAPSPVRDPARLLSPRPDYELSRQAP